MCNLINESTKTVTLHRLEARVIGPRNTIYNFVWNLFYKYKPGGDTLEKEVDPYPVSVAQRDSKLLFVELEIDPSEQVL